MTEELKQAMLIPLIKRVLELSEEYYKTHIFGTSKEDEIKYIIKEL